MKFSFTKFSEPEADPQQPFCPLATPRTNERWRVMRILADCLTRHLEDFSAVITRRILPYLHL